MEMALTVEGQKLNRRQTATKKKKKNPRKNETKFEEWW